MAWSLSEKDYSSIRNLLTKNGLSPSIMRDEQEFKYLRTLLFFNPEKKEYEALTRKAIAHFVSRFEMPNPGNIGSPEEMRAFLKLIARKADLPGQEKTLNYLGLAAGSSQINGFLKNGQVKTSPINTAKDVVTRPPELIRKDDSDDDPASGAWFLFGRNSGKGAIEGDVLLAVPVVITADGGLAYPTDGTMPRMNRDWLEPGNLSAPKPTYMGDLDTLERWLGAHATDTHETWDGYWRWVESMVIKVTGKPLGEIHTFDRQGRGGLSVMSVKDNGRNNAIIQSAYDHGKTGGGLIRAVAQGDASALPLLIEQHSLSQARQAHTGHIDTHVASKPRSGFALERSQRLALNHMMLVNDNQVLAVNGPPGTGKTSFLRGVIATEWIKAASIGNDGIILLATAATNKAVTNIIESFADIAGDEMESSITSRWIAGLPSYGWFYPAKSYDDKNWANYMTLRLNECGESDGVKVECLQALGLAGSFGRRALSGRDAMKQDYLALHAKTFRLPSPLPTPLAAALDIQARLNQSIGVMHRIQVRLMSLLAAHAKTGDMSEDQVRAITDGIQGEIGTRLDTVRDLKNERSLLELEERSFLDDWRARMREQDDRRPKVSDVLKKTRSLVDQIDELASAKQGFMSFLAGLFKWRQNSRHIDDIRHGIDQIAQTITPEYVPDNKLSEKIQLLQDAQKQTKAREADLNREINTLSETLAPRLAQLESLAELKAIHQALLQDARDIGGNTEEFVQILSQTTSAGSFTDNEIIVRVEEWIDLNLRFKHFHLAARYWEARWLDKSMDTRVSRECSRTALLQHYAMLAPVIVSTVYSIHSVNPKIYDYADMLIFDEAGQATPEIGCAAFAMAKKAIVVGDVYQLEPIWSILPSDNTHLLKSAGMAGIHPAYDAAQGSVMRVAQHCSAFGVPTDHHPAGVTLRAHYRCREPIIGYCKELIYGEDLEPRRDERGGEPYLYAPMTWVGVPGQGAVKSGFSRVNMDEVNEIVGWLADDADIIRRHYGKDDLAELVALITPFRGQALALKSAVGEHPKLGKTLAERMTINTVHALQGAEKPIIAFSLAQSKAPFFVDGFDTIKPNLMNVAVSRAKDAFILFAHPDVLRNPDAQSSKPLDVMCRYLARRGQRLYPRELVVIESEQKKRHLQDALGRRAKILSTAGHFKEVAHWPEGHAPVWRVTDQGQPFVAQLADALTEAGQLDAFVLATDDDRDGEEIAWHVLNALIESDHTLAARSVRMRFYSLDPDALRDARKHALPGIDLPRVQASLLKRLADTRLHETIKAATGLTIGRAQIATLRHLNSQANAVKDAPGVIKVIGHVGDQAVQGYLVPNKASTASPLRVSAQEADALIAALAPGGVAKLVGHASVLREYPPFEANTTARVMISGWRRYGWRPDETAQHLQDVYYGSTYLGMSAQEHSS